MATLSTCSALRIITRTNVTKKKSFLLIRNKLYFETENTFEQKLKSYNIDFAFYLDNTVLTIFLIPALKNYIFFSPNRI